MQPHPQTVAPTNHCPGEPNLSATLILACIVLVLAGLMTLAVIYREFLFYSHDSPRRTLFLSAKWILFPHILLASVAFLTGPIQFSFRLRKRNLRLHRLIGKTYVFSILLGAPLTIVLGYVVPVGDANYLFEGIVQSTVWFFTTLIAWLAAQHKQIGLHQMARSYGITFIAVASRFFAPLFSQTGLEFTHFLWFLIVLALLPPELFVNGKALLAGGKKRILHPACFFTTCRFIS